ncbi:MAG: DUF4912 domain-containing protein [Vicinamibacteria bacterium]
MARSDDSTNRKRGPAAKETARPVKKTARAKAAPPRAKAAAPAAPAKKAVKAPPAPRAKAPAAAKPPKAAAAPPPARPSAKAPAPRARKAAEKPASAKKPAKAPAAPRPRRAPRPGVPAPEPVRPPVVLSEEEQIEAAKYLPRELPRLFEEERCDYPECYGQSRIRLLVTDPEWLFAHWDVDPQSLSRVRQELGERASALSRLTLRVTDPHNGGESRVLLPEGARSWYVRADGAERSYQAQLGLTLPSGEFRSLAESNTVRTPRSGPSAEGAPRRARYDGATLSAIQATPPAAERRESAAPAAGPGPWRPDPATASHPGTSAGAPAGSPDADRSRNGRAGEAPGGASDVYRR